MSLMYIKNNSGPKTDPCGTPDKTLNISDRVSDIFKVGIGATNIHSPNTWDGKSQLLGETEVPQAYVTTTTERKIYYPPYVENFAWCLSQ